MTDKQFNKAIEGITINLVKSLRGGQMYNIMTIIIYIAMN